MENSTINEGFEDALSFCDLSFEDEETEINKNNVGFDRQNSLSDREFFEFSTSSSLSSSDSNSVMSDNIIFCGKIISSKTDQGQDSLASSAKNKLPVPPPARSLRCPSTSGSSRKQKVMIGLAKIPSKMDLSDLRERQNRRTPPPMFPASTVVGGGESVDVIGNGSRRKSNWSLLRSFRFKTNGFGSLLPKPCFGSILLARTCID
ncbi:hypothetical protein JCGZ_14763 [Jatropha curcas]|uniref:Uncharacterized protein n=1 Tax=Jatropha curcas TaxID=180498 RepID=A0A067K8I5_JATCU|nr:hypothetical protein JCGZ_14763 [Jatropha curcas]